MIAKHRVDGLEAGRLFSIGLQLSPATHLKEINVRVARNLFTGQHRVELAPLLILQERATRQRSRCDTVRVALPMPLPACEDSELHATVKLVTF